MSSRPAVACRLRAAFGLAALLLAARAPAQATAPAAEPRPIASAITVSGGVSLGAHEAGVLYYAGGAEARSGATSLRLLTGASAGSLNAILAVLAACGGEAATPQASLMWQTWIPTGFDELFVPSQVSPLGAFSRGWLGQVATRIEAAWSRGLEASCDVVLGISMSRLEPRLLGTPGGRLQLPSMEEKVTVRVRGRGAGRPPLVTNYPAHAGRRQELLLVTDERGEIAFGELRDLVMASMAVPVAFPPQRVRSCESGRTARPGICLSGEAQEALYVDGGVLDNGPLRLAVGLARAGLEERPGGRLDWRELPSAQAREVSPRVVFAFLDPALTDFPPTPASAPSLEPGLTQEILGLFEAFVATARSKELAVLLEEQPDIADRVLVPRRHFPAASAPLFAFLGFFETEFRIFDFHLGMYDARRMLAEARRPGVDPGGAASSGPAGPGWERFACMRAVYDGGGDGGECLGEGLADFRALLQLSLDQLYVACAAPGRPGGQRPGDHPHCERAGRGEAPARVPGLSPARWPDWRRGRAESELAHSTRLLAAYGFSFHDLGVPAGRGDLALRRIRGELGRAAKAISAAQPVLQRAPVSMLTKLAVDTVAYAPPDQVIHLTTGPTETELGLSHGQSGSAWAPPWLRVTGVVGFRGLDEVFSAGEAGRFALLPAAGLEYLPPTSAALARLRFGLRAGWLLAAGDGYGTGPCRNRGAGSVTDCSRPVVQAMAGVALLERLRLQIVGEWYPGTLTRSRMWSVAPGLGLEFGY